ncbi:MAG: nucleotidyl transferase AbiEii/AbiGii toxin family protein [Desulfobacteraceae bacterium]|nr:MAG: nucleotidyl transferase AbiEii/AbiGii toxin family protein [Desulfobacteraceae bacterium]
MSPSKKRDAGHSVFQRLLNHAKTHGEDFNLLLFRYSVERFLYRLSISSHADRFVLKGASLFLVWKGQNYRVTRDADLLGIGPADAEHLIDIFKELCKVASNDVDGIEFMPDTVRAVPIREEQEYGGVRVTIMGLLHQARIPLQVDIGFGDVVTPEPERIRFPTILNAPQPQLLAYPRYTMVAEKFEAMVRLGVANSRMKDFYDVWLLSRFFEFDGRTLCEAIRNTFRRRSTALPDGLPVAFTDEFRKDVQKQTQWRAFVRNSKPENVSGDIDAVIGNVVVFLIPVMEAARREQPFELSWLQGGPWGETAKVR